jgi:hypothetical protein
MGESRLFLLITQLLANTPKVEVKGLTIMTRGELIDRMNIYQCVKPVRWTNQASSYVIGRLEHPNITTC